MRSIYTYRISTSKSLQDRSTIKGLIDFFNFTLVGEHWIIAGIRSHRVIPRDRGLFRYFS